MIKLFTQNLNNNFTNNILNINDNDIIVSTGGTNNVLYKIHYKYNFTHYIFNVSMLNNETSQFIAEYFSKIRIFLFHDKKIDTDVLKQYENFCVNILQEDEDGFNCKVLPKNIINENIYKDYGLTRDKDTIAFFLDGLDDIPNNIKSLLYPETKLKIKLYNSTSIKHPQNLGLLSEQNKATILNSSDYFILYNHSYEQEAVVCGCKILNYDNINTKDVMNIPRNHTTYKQFLLDIL